MNKNFFLENPNELFYCPVSGELLTAAEWLQIQKDCKNGEMFPDGDFEHLLHEEEVDKDDVLSAKMSEMANR